MESIWTSLNIKEPFSQDSKLEDLISLIDSFFTVVAQSNYGFDSSVRNFKLPANPVKQICNFIDKSKTDSILTLSNIFKMIFPNKISINFFKLSKSADYLFCNQLAMPFGNDFDESIFYP